MTDMGQYDAAKPVKGGDSKAFDNHRERLARLNAQYEIIDMAKEIRRIEAARVSGELKPVQAGDKRETALCKGVVAVARYYGDVLKTIIGIDANGEFSIASKPVKPFDLAGVPFSAAFCEALNTHTRPRCGVLPGAVMEPDHSNWCRINHFEAERMVLSIADALESV